MQNQLQLNIKHVQLHIYMNISFNKKEFIIEKDYLKKLEKGSSYYVHLSFNKTYNY